MRGRNLKIHSAPANCCSVETGSPGGQTDQVSKGSQKSVLFCKLSMFHCRHVINIKKFRLASCL